MALPTHPFAVNVQRPRRKGEGYTWTIKHSGVIQSRSVFDYPSFEEARLAMKAALGGLVVRWEAAR